MSFSCPKLRLERREDGFCPSAMKSLRGSVQLFVVVGHPCQGFVDQTAYKHVLFEYGGLVRKLPFYLFGSES